MTGRRGLVLVYAGLGATAASLGPLLPALASDLDVAPAVLSLMTTCLFAGLVVGAAATAVVVRRWAAGRLLAAGCAVQAVGLVGMTVATGPEAVFAAAGLLGVGFGVGEVTASALVARRPDGPSRLAMLTAVFAGAAITTPVLVSTSLGVTGSVVGAGLLVAALQLGAGLAVAHDATHLAVPHADTRDGNPPGPAPSPVIATLLLVVYVGAETTLATWSGELGRALLDLTTGWAAFAPTGFWVCLLAGRILGARLLARGDAARMLVRSLALGGACALVAAMLTPATGALSLALAAAAVVAMGPVYGVVLALGARPGRGSGVTRTAWLVGVGAVGGALVPAGVAPVAGFGPGAVLALAGACLVAAAALGRRLRPRAAAPRAAATVRRR